MGNVRRIIEFCFRHEPAIIKAVEEKRLDARIVAGGGGHSRISDPTAQKAIANLSDVARVDVEYGAFVNGRRNTMTIRRPLQWLKVAHWVKDYYAGRQQGELIRLKYHESRSREDIVDVMHISQATYYVMLADIFAFAAGLAVGLGLKPLNAKIFYKDSRIDIPK